jgi:hypothetical protein
MGFSNIISNYLYAIRRFHLSHGFSQTVSSVDGLFCAVKATDAAHSSLTVVPIIARRVRLVILSGRLIRLSHVDWDVCLPYHSPSPFAV